MNSKELGDKVNYVRVNVCISECNVRYNFDWKVIGQFDSKKVRLLDRNNGLLLKSLEIYKGRKSKKSIRKEEIKYDNTSQLSIDKAWG